MAQNTGKLVEYQTKVNGKERIWKITERPTEVAGRAYTRYYVSFGSDANGNRVRKNYGSLEDAKVGIDQHEELTEKIGRRAKQLTDEKLHDAAEAFVVLDGRTSLKDAAQFWVNHHKIDGENKTVRDLVDAYEEDRRKSNRRPDTIRDILSHLTPLAETMEVIPANHVSTEDLKRWMKTQNGGASTKKKRRRHLVGLFNFGVEEKFCTTNPAVDIKVRDRGEGKTKPHVLPVKDVEKIMQHTETKEAGMIPYMALTIFAGVRPAEAQRLDWKDIDIARSEVFISDAVSKTHDERYVPLEPNALAWIMPYADTSGPVFFSRRKFEKIREKANVRWEHDCARHSYGSYHLAAFDNAGRTAENMGHKGLGMLFKHYRRAVRKEDAEQFWQIMPQPVEADETLKFPKAS